MRFSFFKRTGADVSLIITFIEKLIVQAEQLFLPGRVTIHEHFQKIESMSCEGFQEGAFLEAEHGLVHELQKRLIVDSSNDEKYYAEDLAQAVSLYLGGMLKGDFEDDEEDENADKETSEEFSKIMSFENADGALYLEQSEEIVHLCGLDEESLPYSAQALPWPLSRPALESTNRPELEMIFIRKDNILQLPVICIIMCLLLCRLSDYLGFVNLEGSRSRNRYTLCRWVFKRIQRQKYSPNRS